MTMKRKQQSSVFDAVASLENQDAKAVKSQRRASERDQARSKAAQSQTAIYGSLVESRILLQRSLQAKDAPTNISAAVDQCNDLLAKLLHARQTLFPIHTYDDGRDDHAPPNYKEVVNDESKLSKKLKAEYNHYQEEWKEVLDRRNKDVQLHSGSTTNKTQFHVMDASFWQQVENTVQHELLRQQQSSNEPREFDDTKLYQHLLKDFVAAKSGAAPTQHAALQRKQNKKKPQVDRRASKGRKIRYTGIQKLEHFTFPLSRPAVAANDLDEDAWFKSLFGGASRSK